MEPKSNNLAPQLPYTGAKGVKKLLNYMFILFYIKYIILFMCSY